MTLPPGWESFWQSAIPRLRRERVAYRKIGTDIIVQWVGIYWHVMRGEKLLRGGFPSAAEAVEWADKQEVAT